MQGYHALPGDLQGAVLLCLLSLAPFVVDCGVCLGVHQEKVEATQEKTQVHYSHPPTEYECYHQPQQANY